MRGGGFVIILGNANAHAHGRGRSKINVAHMQCAMQLSDGAHAEQMQI